MNKEEMFDLVSECTSLEMFIAKIEKYINNPFWLMNDAYQTIAYTKTQKTNYYLSLLKDREEKKKFVNQWIQIGLLDDKEGIVHPKRMYEPAFGKDVYVLDVFFKKHPIAKMTVVIEQEIQPDDVALLAKGLSLYLRNTPANYGSKQEHALSLLLQTDLESQSLGKELLEKIDYNMDGTFHIAYVDTDITNRTTLLRTFLADAEKESHDILAGFVQDKCFIIMPVKLKLHCIQDYQIRIAYSYPFELFEQLYGYGRQAEYACHITQKKETYFMDVIDSFFTHAVQKELPLETMIDIRVKNIIAYDKKYQTKYFETLNAYISHQNSKQRTADALFVHINTVKYRLQQIEKLFNINLELDDHILRISLALQNMM